MMERTKVDEGCEERKVGEGECSSTAGRASCEGEGLGVQRGGHAQGSSTSSEVLASQETTSREQNDFASTNQAREEGTTGRFGFTLAAAGARIRRTADAALGRARRLFFRDQG